MNKKAILLVIIIGGIIALALLFVFKKQADDARKVSDKILEDFKKADESLKRTNDSIEKALPKLLDSLHTKL